jgi:undecaprenyl-diphosphatase
MDFSLVHHLNAFFAGHDGLEDVVTLYERVAELLFLGALLATFALVRGAGRIAARRAVAAAGLSAGLGLALASLLAQLVDRPRPFVAHPDGVHLFAPHAADAGFPSDHATAAFAIATAILLRDRRWGLPVLVAAIVLAAGRVAIGVHYPTDVLAGAALGAACAAVLHAAVVRARLHALADACGGVLDRVVAAAAPALRRG